MLVALNSWLSYTETIVWELALAGSALVVLDKWLSYRGGRLSRFDCILINYSSNIKQDKNNFDSQLIKMS